MVFLQYIAGFAKGGTSLPFWEDVYGFNMRCVGEEVVQDATQSPIIDVVESKEVITNSCLIQVHPRLLCFKRLTCPINTSKKRRTLCDKIAGTECSRITWY